MKALRIILSLAFFVVSAYFLGKMTGRIYFDPVCKRYGEALGYTYTDYKIRYRGSPAKCYYLDEKGQFESVLLSEIPKQFMDYVRGILQYALLMVVLVCLVALTKAIGGEND